MESTNSGTITFTTDRGDITPPWAEWRTEAPPWHDGRLSRLPVQQIEGRLQELFSDMGDAGEQFDLSEDDKVFLFSLSGDELALVLRWIRDRMFDGVLAAFHDSLQSAKVGIQGEREAAE